MEPWNQSKLFHLRDSVSQTKDLPVPAGKSLKAILPRILLLALYIQQKQLKRPQYLVTRNIFLGGLQDKCIIMSLCNSNLAIIYLTDSKHPQSMRGY